MGGLEQYYLRADTGESGETDWNGGKLRSVNDQNWYTDTADVFRAVCTKEGNLTRQDRIQVLEGIPCRVYRSDDRAISMSQTAASVKQESMLACDNAVDIRTGDELIIHRGGGLGEEVFDMRAFAGEAHYYFEPFGAVTPGLAHQEVRLLQEERVK